MIELGRPALASSVSTILCLGAHCGRYRRLAAGAPSYASLQMNPDRGGDVGRAQSGRNGAGHRGATQRRAHPEGGCVSEDVL